MSDDSSVISRSRPDLETTWVRNLADRDATDALARELAASLGAGDLVTLGGDLGSGKTTFARALIRSLTGDETLDVPSPTFTLMQVYERQVDERPSFPIVHADLYRIKDASELYELGWDEAADGALVLVEWAERAGQSLAFDRLDITFILDSEESDEHRIAVLTGHGIWSTRLTLMKKIGTMLDNAGWSAATRTHMQGDASTRAYERLTLEDEAAILMIAPRRPDGPPVRGGRPYSGVARLAESVHAFVAVANGLRAQGFSAPAILAQDLDAGLLLTEDLGTEPCHTSEGPIAERYGEAVLALARLHHGASDGRPLPETLPVTATLAHRLPAYDLDSYLIEAELLLDWTVPKEQRSSFSGAPRGKFIEAWSHALEPIIGGPRTWTLRDVHSPNLLWLADRRGFARIGLIDFQDATMGHPAYDVVSLLQDARIDVPEELELKLLGVYARARAKADPAFDMGAFAAAYSTLGAQRATKILGIFARLNERDGKPGYLQHVPRIERHLRRCLGAPALAELLAWYRQYMPRLVEG